MKYVVKWENEEKEFCDARKALIFADEVSKDGVNSYIWVEKDGVREDEPYIRNEWSI